MKTILISGKSGSGKDVFASFLKNELEENGKHTIITHYGDPVKYFAKEYFGWDGIKDENGRHLLQTLGTELVRSVLPNYWTGVIVGFLDAMEAHNKFDVAIIADIRFENEAEIPYEQLEDVTLIRMSRYNPDGTPWINPVLTEEQRNHSSETSLDEYNGFDYIIHNDEGLDTLKESARALLIDMKLIEGEIND